MQVVQAQTSCFWIDINELKRLEGQNGKGVQTKGPTGTHAFLGCMTIRSVAESCDKSLQIFETCILER